MMNNKSNYKNIDYDAIVIGAGFSGMYMLYRLRKAGFSTRVIEKGNGVGGAWYWSRYPGARCDSDSICYNFTFSKELYKEWTWTSRYPDQNEILQYLNFVADRLELRRDIQFNTEVIAAHYDEENNKWIIHLKNGDKVSARYFITGVGCLSVNATNIPRIKGLDQFEGDWYHTGAWPHEKVEFRGKRVGVIGTGSSGIQAIPAIAREAEHLTVFQRTPQYAIPARNHLLDNEFIRNTKENFDTIKQKMRYENNSGMLREQSSRSALEDSPEERQQVYERLWEKGGGGFLAESYKDILTNEEANKTASDFVRSKIREIVRDPYVREKLIPTYYIGAKRIVLDSGYYETYNRKNVSLVDVKENPIKEITPRGLRTENSEHELDILVFATGYDGMTGPLLKFDIHGKKGVSLKEKWGDGGMVKTYLGLSIPGFPNMFTITGPQSPSVLGNVPTMIEQHVEWISDCIESLREKGVEKIEAQEEAAENWVRHCNELADNTLYTKVDSWYTGSNVEGKPRAFLIYTGGLQQYREKCEEVASNGYEGFYLMSASNSLA